MENKETLKDYKNQSLAEMFALGWWCADLKKEQFSYGNLTADILSLEPGPIPLQSFYKIIREEFRARIMEIMENISEGEVRQMAFPVYVRKETQWVSVRLIKGAATDCVEGLMARVEQVDGLAVSETEQETVRNLIYQLKGISRSLFAFTQNENLHDTIIHILRSLVTQYSAERAYIFEYNWEKMNQSCTYEVVSRPGLEEIQNLQNMLFNPDSWWNQQILARRPIILNTLDDLPEWDKADRRVLEAQDIQSLMVVPFFNKENIPWGYAGIDIVDSQRTWTEADYQWFSSLMQIINICIELGKSKDRIQKDKEELEEMIRAKDKAETLDRLKSAFLANMSHEIRTPLNSIIGFSDLLAETKDEEERREFIAIIQRNNELLLQLVSDILDLSKIESGTFDFVRREMNVKTICSEVIFSLSNRERAEDVQLLFDEDLPGIIMYADTGRVKQVLMNFITNSIKFTEKGYIRLGYELKEQEEQVLFYVEDTGKGVAREDIERIFERFVKLNSFAQGSGLGLSICRSLIEEMGGELGVESEEGKGSRFWFTLPRHLELADDGQKFKAPVRKLQI